MGNAPKVLNAPEKSNLLMVSVLTHVKAPEVLVLLQIYKAPKISKSPKMAKAPKRRISLKGQSF
jgi:hypothetical protein